MLLESRIDPAVVPPGVHHLQVRAEALGSKTVDNFAGIHIIIPAVDPAKAGDHIAPHAERTVRLAAHGIAACLIQAHGGDNILEDLDHPFPVGNSLGIGFPGGEHHVVFPVAVFFPRPGEGFAGDGILAVIHDPVTAVQHAAPGTRHHFIGVVEAEDLLLTVHRCVLLAGIQRMTFKPGHVVGHILFHIFGDVQRHAFIIHFRRAHAHDLDIHHIRIIAGSDEGVRVVGFPAARRRQHRETDLAGVAVAVRIPILGKHVLQARRVLILVKVETFDAVCNHVAEGSGFSEVIIAPDFRRGSDERQEHHCCQEARQ